MRFDPPDIAQRHRVDCNSRPRRSAGTLAPNCCAPAATALVGRDRSLPGLVADAQTPPLDDLCELRRGLGNVSGSRPITARLPCGI